VNSNGCSKYGSQLQYGRDCKVEVDQGRAALKKIEDFRRLIMYSSGRIRGNVLQMATENQHAYLLRSFVLRALSDFHALKVPDVF
jgi:hypothetical protein